MQGAISVHYVTTSNLTLDHGKGEQAVAQYLAVFEKLRQALTDDEIREKYKQYKKDFLPPYEDTLKPDTWPKFNFFNGFLSYFKPAAGYFVTPILIWLNILIFIMMVLTGGSLFEPGVPHMISWGANATVSTLDGQWWRLVTSCFIHFGIIHLLLNMFALFYVGFLLEPFLGKTRLITAYLLTGVAGSLVSLWWHDYTVSGGASGAIFGMYGVFLALLSTNHIERSMRKGLFTIIGAFVVYNLVYGSIKDGTDNAAHVGGLFSGILIGYLYLPGLRDPDNKKLNWVSLTGIVGLMLIGSAVSYTLMAQSDSFVYQKRMQAFYQLETRAVAGVADQEGLSNPQLLAGLQKGITYWKTGISLIKELDSLRLSKKTHRKNKVLINYCLLRIKSYQLQYNAAKDGILPDQSQLQQISQQIRSTLDELK